MQHMDSKFKYGEQTKNGKLAKLCLGKTSQQISSGPPLREYNWMWDIPGAGFHDICTSRASYDVMS